MWQQLFPDPKNASRICSRCYEGLRLHQQGVMLSSFGVVAIVLGAGLLVRARRAAAHRLRRQ